MSFKAGNSAKDFGCTNAPTVGPGIKSTGARMREQDAEGYSKKLLSPSMMAIWLYPSWAEHVLERK